MARAMLVAAALAGLAVGARYADYADGNLPNYGAASDYEGPRDLPAADDYHDSHLHEVSMALDYKFPEDPVGRSYNSRSKDATHKEFEEMDIWQKQEKNEKRLSRSQDSDNNYANFDKYHTTQNILNFGLNKPMLKVPLRHKTRSVGDGENLMQKQGDIYDMRSIKDVNGFGHSPTQAETSEDKMIEFRDRNRLRNKANLFRAKVRRKPRDKIDKDNFGDPPTLDEDELSLLKKYVNGDKKDLDYSILGPEIDLPKLPPAESHDIKKTKISKPLKLQNDYDEYYDMKRVNSIKEKLPGLFLLSSTGAAAEMRKDTLFLSTELVRDDIIWANRRMVPDPETPAPLESTSSSSFTTIKTTFTATPSTTISNNISVVANDEMSLAEKSKLSILKKAQKKESFGKALSTSKPPVLLQVASKPQTLLMVEPPTSPDPLFRAREVPEETPERLILVKRMMRHKLVAGARSIRELTDNWDEMVCDYVDISLLENTATFKCNTSILFGVTIILFFLLIT